MIDFIFKNKYRLVLGGFIIGYIIVFSYLTIIRYLSFGSHYYDLGIMNQVVYNTSRGYFLEMTNQDLVKNLSRLAIHFDPILALFAPFYWIYPGPEVLLVGETIFLALGGLAVFLISQKLLKKEFYSLLFSLLYFLYYPLHRINLFDFHGVVLALPFLLFGFYFLLLGSKKNKNLGLFFIFLSFLTKENTPLMVLFLGLYIYLFKRDKKLGFFLIGISGLVFLTVIFFLIPFFRQGDHFALGYYTLDMKKNLHRLIKNDSLDYIIKLTRPLGFLPLLSPAVLAIGLPQFLINLLSANPNMRNLYFHYSSTIIPFVFIGAIYGLARVIGFLNQYPEKRNRLLTVIFILVFGLSLYDGFRFGPLADFSYQIDEKKLFYVNYWRKKLKDDQIKVSSTPQLAPFFTSRRYYYNFLFDPAYKERGLSEKTLIKNLDKYKKADFVVIGKWEIDANSPLIKMFYENLKENKDFSLVFNKQDIEVYKRVSY